MEYNEITPTLVVGSCPRSISDIDDLVTRAGITAVLCVQTEEDIRYHGLGWESLKQYYAQKGVELKHMPVKDFDSTDLQSKLPECVEALHDLQNSGYKTYVHCSAGVNRSPSIVIAYLHWKCKLELTESFALVSKCRSCVPDLEAIRLAASAVLKDVAT